MTEDDVVSTAGTRAHTLSRAKQIVLASNAALDRALADGKVDEVERVLATHTVGDRYRWRGMHPFGDLTGADEVADSFYRPLVEAFHPLQRRPDVFLAGHNDVDHTAVDHRAIDHGALDHDGDGGEDESVWVCQMGHLLGLFDRPWLDIPPTRKMCFLRYAEFHRVLPEADTGEPGSGSIAESSLFIDVISVMAQAGVYPLPPQTGADHLHPGPATHDGLLLGDQDPAESVRTMDLVNRMIDDLTEANEIAARTGNDRVPADVLRRCWHTDMIWSGPAGIGATYTIDRYQEQHQYPFRFGLADKTFNGHVARFAEGHYACFFGWANLTNRPTGGFLGLPGSDTPADMRVVDVYRRDGDKLAENWVFIDLLHWLSMQGLDVLARMRQLQGIDQL